MADVRFGTMNLRRGKWHGCKGEVTLFQSKVRKREKVRKSSVGRVHIISQNEEIPWVAQGEITPLPRGYLEEFILPLQGQRGSQGAIEQHSTAGSEVYTESIKAIIGINLCVCTKHLLFYSRTEQRAETGTDLR